jgi:hypothetical protein
LVETGQTPFAAVHKNALIPWPKPEMFTDEPLPEITAGPDNTDHDPVPKVWVIAASVVDEEHTV